MVVSNSAGSVTSNTATLTVNATSLAINVSPNSATVKRGSTQQFAGIITGSSNTAVTWTWAAAVALARRVVQFRPVDLYISPSSRTLASHGHCESNQRGGPHKISIGKCDNCGGDCGLVKHQPSERFCSYRWHSTFQRKRDRDFEHGSELECERNGLLRLIMRDNFNQRVVSCLFSAKCGSCASKRQCDLQPAWRIPPNRLQQV